MKILDHPVIPVVVIASRKKNSFWNPMRRLLAETHERAVGPQGQCVDALRLARDEVEDGIGGSLIGDKSIIVDDGPAILDRGILNGKPLLIGYRQQIGATLIHPHVTVPDGLRKRHWGCDDARGAAERWPPDIERNQIGSATEAVLVRQPPEPVGPCGTRLETVQVHRGGGGGEGPVS